MKILFPVYVFYPSQLGGPANTVYWHCKALKKKGLNPIIVTTTYGISNQNLLKLKNGTGECGEINYIAYDKFSGIKLLIESVKKIKEVDCIHFSSFFYWPNFFIAFISILLFKKKVVWSPRGEMSNNAMIYGSKLKKIYLKLIKTFLRNKITFHATSKKESNEISKNLGEGVNIIELPNYLELKPPLEAKSHKYLLFIGRIHPIKALDNLLLALKHSEVFLQSEYKLLIAGDTDGTKESEEYLQSISNFIQANELKLKIEMLGQVIDEKDSIYSNAFFTILPSHTENFGNVVIESLAHGTPVIASKGTPWQILENNVAGFWVNNDIESLTHIINHAIELDEKNYFTMRENALKLVSTMFDIEVNIIKWITQYKKITSNR